MPGSGVPGGGVELDQPTDSIFTPPHAGYNFDPGGGEPTLPLTAGTLKRPFANR